MSERLFTCAACGFQRPGPIVEHHCPGKLQLGPHPDEPTDEQCDNRERVFDWHGWLAMAARLPDDSRAVLVVREDGDYDAYVWRHGRRTPVVERLSGAYETTAS